MADAGVMRTSPVASLRSAPTMAVFALTCAFLYLVAETDDTLKS
jgi:hypothetical protein